MPPINKYRCSRCGFSFPEGWGGYFYVEVDEETLRKRYSELEAQLVDLQDALEKVGNAIAKIQKMLSEYVKSVEDQFHNAVFPNLQIYLQQIQRLYMERVYDEASLGNFKPYLESLLSATDVKGKFFLSLRNSLKEIENNFISWLRMNERYIQERVSLFKRQISELKEIEKRIKADGVQALRIKCPHPGEHGMVEQVLGRVSSEVAKSKTGFNSYVICLDCLYQFEADLRDERVNEWRFWYGFPSFAEAFRGKPQMKDERKCPKCGSLNVKTTFEMIGKKCPKCKEGIVEEIETGVMA